MPYALSKKFQDLPISERTLTALKDGKLVHAATGLLVVVFENGVAELEIVTFVSLQEVSPG